MTDISHPNDWATNCRNNEWNACVGFGLCARQGDPLFDSLYAFVVRLKREHDDYDPAALGIWLICHGTPNTTPIVAVFLDAYSKFVYGTDFGMSRLDRFVDGTCLTLFRTALDRHGASDELKNAPSHIVFLH